jgi:histidinol-phosphate phosphatase family protein
VPAIDKMVGIFFAVTAHQHDNQGEGNKNTLRAALFLDRDGVIIENRDDYVRSWADVEFIPASIEALKSVASLDIAIVILTNQACVGKGILSLDAAEAINNRVMREVNALGGRIDAAYLCPHRPGESCACRKPKPGMLLRAAREHTLKLSQSAMVGDAITDMQAAQSAGVSGILVRTGRGQRELDTFAGQPWFDIAGDLCHAIEMLYQINKPVP